MSNFYCTWFIQWTNKVYEMHYHVLQVYIKLVLNQNVPLVFRRYTEASKEWHCI